MPDFRDILEKIKDFFSVDNLSKRRNKVILLIIVLAIVPLIVFLSVSAGEANRLAIAEGPVWISNVQISGEEKFQINLFDPIARDINSGNYRIINYNISFQKDESHIYLLPDNIYWVKVENVTITMHFTTGVKAWNYSVYSSHIEANENLSFGEFITGTFDFTDLFENYVGADKNTWDTFRIELIANCTHYYNAEDEYVTNQVIYSGRVVDQNNLFTLNYPQGQRIALQVLIIYWVITGLALGAYLFYLNKKKYSFIRPY